MIVVKFGGTSVASAEAIERAAKIVASRVNRSPLVVVSALGGTTNALLVIAEQAASGQLIGALHGIQSLRERHLRECELLLGSSEAGNEVACEISALFDELASLAEAFCTLGHATPRSMDAVTSFGELMSSMLVTEALKLHGVKAVHVDARKVMITNDDFTEAEPRTDIVSDKAREVILPLLRAGEVPVMGGYIGSNASGITTTLGRGGSDYSASVIGAALGAEAIEIWTDVDGMLTADPRVVKSSRLIEEIRFDEASELASFGAKVLHPSTISPAVKLGIPVFIYNSRNAAGKGTRITFDAPRRPVSAIAGRGDITIVKVRAPRMLFAHGFLRTVFEVFDRHETSVDVVSTSEVSVSVTIDDTSNLDSLVVDLRRLGDVSVERNRGVVAIVGSGIGDNCGEMGRALGALGGIKVHMMSLSATGINLTVIVDSVRINEAIQLLHEEFFKDVRSNQLSEVA